jgi:carboxylesterase
MIHGLGGSPTSLGDVPDGLRSRGWEVHTPVLPGHGTSVDDLEGLTFDHWSNAVMAAVTNGERGHGVVLVGQSLGGVLALCAADTSSAVRGVVTINAPVTPADPDVVEHLDWLIDRGVTRRPAGEPDLRDPHAVDPGYDELPVSALRALVDAGDRATASVPRVRVPALVITSDHDQVVDPALGDALARGLGGPVTRLRLPNSGHVACRDLDRQRLTTEIADWLHLLSAAST